MNEHLFILLYLLIGLLVAMYTARSGKEDSDLEEIKLLSFIILAWPITPIGVAALFLGGKNAEQYKKRTRELDLT